MTLGSQLSSLENAALVRLVETLPEIEYIFHHELIREVVYKSLLRAERRRLHRVIGESLERLHPEQGDELAPLLAQHFDLGGEAPRAVKYFTRAGDVAMHYFATVEATEHYARALHLAPPMTTEPREQQQIYIKY